MDYFHRWLFRKPHKEGDSQKIPHLLTSLPSRKDYNLQQNSHALIVRAFSPTGIQHPSLHPGSPAHAAAPYPALGAGRSIPRPSIPSPLDDGKIEKRVVYRNDQGETIQPVVMHEIEDEPKEDGDSSDGETIELEAMWPDTHPTIPSPKTE